jgi:hypothetical protein
LGNVEIGDYILPSGLNNGLGKAVHPADMKAEDYARIVGVAWSSSKGKSYSKINVAIGLNANDISRVVTEQTALIKQQGEAIALLKQQMNETHEMLAKLVSGYKNPAPMQEVTINNVTGKNDHPEFDITTSGTTTIKKDHSDVVYFDVTHSQVQAMFDMAEKIFVENGGDVTKHPFWSKIKSDPSYKEATMQQLESKFKQAVHSHKNVNAKYALH